MAASSEKQLVLPLGKKPRRRNVGPDGKLVPLGRRPKADRVGFMLHEPREEHDPAHPVLVTIRRLEQGPDLRAERVSAAIRTVVAAAKTKGQRVVDYAIHADHLHFVMEAENARDLSSQVRTLFSRIAFAVNAAAGRYGRLFGDRHQRQPLKTASELRKTTDSIVADEAGRCRWCSEHA